MATRLRYVVFGKIGVKNSTDAGFAHRMVWQLYFSRLKASSRNRVRQKLAQLIFAQWRTHIPDLVISSSFLLDCQVKRSLWFLHFIRTVFLERFVELHRASGVTFSKGLWRERSSVTSFTAALPCFWSSLPPPNEKFSVFFRILFQQYISPTQLSGLISGSKTKMQRKKPRKGSLQDQGVVVTELPGFEELFLFFFC